ncbi:HAD family hydrolase, partial [Clostridioides difficile]|nr:HAD family hydrolase [Clostridioides difficile]
AVPGRGVQARINGKLYFAGSQKFAEEKGIAAEKQRQDMERLAMEGKTPLLFFDEKEILGIIAAADVVKDTSAQAIREMKKLGIEVIML